MTSTRLATMADAAAIAAIYNEGIADWIATFETEPRTPERIAAQLADRGDRHPTVVAERDGRVVAWASAGPWRSPGVRRRRRALGLCRARLAKDGRRPRRPRRALPRLRRARLLEARLAHLGRERRERALHERCGFRVVGVYHRHGKLGDEFHDCVTVERVLDEPIRRQRGALMAPVPSGLQSSTWPDRRGAASVDGAGRHHPLAGLARDP